MSAPVAVVNHHCTLACPKIALHVAADHSCGTEVATIKVLLEKGIVASVLLDYVPRRFRVILALAGAGELEAETLALVFLEK
jgi:hypothetical protein